MQNGIQVKDGMIFQEERRPSIHSWNEQVNNTHMTSVIYSFSLFYSFQVIKALLTLKQKHTGAATFPHE